MPVFIVVLESAHHTVEPLIGGCSPHPSQLVLLVRESLEGMALLVSI
jgi:hypothetical protein